MKLPKRVEPKNKEEFVTRASDEKGHHTGVTVAIPEQVAEIISQIIEKGYFPYRSKADLIRDAIYHRLKWLIEKHELGYGALLRSERAIDHIVDSVLHSKETNERLKKLDQAMADLSGDEEAQVDLVNLVHSEIMAMPEGHWRKRHLDYVKDHYRHLIKPWNMQERGKE